MAGVNICKNTMYENGMGVSVSAYVYVCEKIPVYICISRSSFMSVSEYIYM